MQMAEYSQQNERQGICPKCGEEIREAYKEYSINCLFMDLEEMIDCYYSFEEFKEMKLKELEMEVLENE